MPVVLFCTSVNMLPVLLIVYVLMPMLPVVLSEVRCHRLMSQIGAHRHHRYLHLARLSGSSIVLQFEADLSLKSDFDQFNLADSRVRL